MSGNRLSVIAYEEKYEEKWDRFVKEQSANGTFLQTRRFLNYHPKNRFAGASCIVMDEKEEWIAVCPACLDMEGGEKVLYAHKGSTYGGVIVRNDWYRAHRMLNVLECLEERWKMGGIDRVVLKQTPDILAKSGQDLMEYCFYYLGYTAHKELNIYVDFDGYSEDILSELTRRKRRNVYACEREGCAWKRVDTVDGVERFYQLLCLTLEKYDKKPVHTPGELYEFVTERLKDECEIYGVYKDNEMIAGTMLFYFQDVKTAHTQYLCADPQFNRLSPMTYTYYKVLCEMRRQGFRKVSWGIVTEDMGRYLNDGLVDSKEEFGSRHGVNITYQKRLV